MTFDGTHTDQDLADLRNIAAGGWRSTTLPQGIVEASKAERAAFRAYINCDLDALTLRAHHDAWTLKASELAGVVSAHVQDAQS